MIKRGKIALVTGAGRGIGRGIALRLAREGADVLVNAARNRDAAQQTAEAIRTLGRRALVAMADVADEEAVSDMVARGEAELGPIEILVNNAGILKSGPIADLSRKDWQRVLDVNLTGPFLCSRIVGARLISRGRSGVIVNVASISGHMPEVSTGAYTPSKAGLIGLTRLLAAEWAAYGIRVNAVSPGPVLTPLQQSAYPTEALLNARNRAIPIGRHGTPEEIGAAVAFLVSDDAAFITGQEITVDGGSMVSMFSLVRTMASGAV
jgi:3-oxoacyl-[acyl-carrier protein] reductase